MLRTKLLLGATVLGILTSNGMATPPAKVLTSSPHHNKEVDPPKPSKSNGGEPKNKGEEPKVLPDTSKNGDIIKPKAGKEIGLGKGPKWTPVPSPITPAPVTVGDTASTVKPGGTTTTPKTQGQNPGSSVAGTNPQTKHGKWRPHGKGDGLADAIAALGNLGQSLGQGGNSGGAGSSSGSGETAGTSGSGAGSTEAATTGTSGSAPAESSSSTTPTTTGTTTGQPASADEAGVPPSEPALLGVVLLKNPQADSPAATAKLKANDVIMALGGVRIENPGDLEAAGKKFAGQSVVVKYLDGATGEAQSASVTPAADGSLGAEFQQVQVN